MNDFARCAAYKVGPSLHHHHHPVPSPLLLPLFFDFSSRSRLLSSSILFLLLLALDVFVRSREVSRPGADSFRQYLFIQSVFSIPLSFS
jgi:hypothetical protein